MINDVIHHELEWIGAFQLVMELPLYRWMLFEEHLNRKWMIYGYTHDSGNPHLAKWPLGLLITSKAIPAKVSQPRLVIVGNFETRSNTVKCGKMHSTAQKNWKPVPRISGNWDICNIFPGVPLLYLFWGCSRPIKTQSVWTCVDYFCNTQAQKD